MKSADLNIAAALIGEKNDNDRIKRNLGSAEMTLRVFNANFSHSITTTDSILLERLRDVARDYADKRDAELARQAAAIGLEF